MIPVSQPLPLCPPLAAAGHDEDGTRMEGIGNVTDCVTTWAEVTDRYRHGMENRECHGFPVGFMGLYIYWFIALFPEPIAKKSLCKSVKKW